MNIDRCYCFQVRFSKLHEIAKETGAASVAELQEHVLFGKQCELCHPYVERMLETGETVFHETIPQPEERNSSEREKG